MDSNDLLDLQSFQIYNCEGMALDWSGPSSASDESFSSTVVEYDYDMFINSGSDTNTALAKLQHTLLEHVGSDIFSDCSSSRKLSISGRVGRQLDGTIVEEITSAPSDVVSDGSCLIKGKTTDAECYPVTGYITAYYANSDNIRRLKSEEASIQQAITGSVKTAMEDGTLTSDATQGVYFLGDRETYKLNFLKEDTDSTSWWSNNMGLVIGAGVGLVAMVLVVVIFKKRMSSKKKGAAHSNSSPDLEDQVMNECEENRDEELAPPPIHCFCF